MISNKRTRLFSILVKTYILALYFFLKNQECIEKRKRYGVTHLWFWQASVVHEDSGLEVLAHGRKPSTSEPEHLVVKFL